MAKLTIQHIAGNTYYLPAPVNVGLYVRDQRAILIDSGNDQEAGRQILKLLQERAWTLELIINTHSNADHIGGNAFLQQKTNCRIAATAAEAMFIQQPEFEPAFLYGGFPTQELRNKFLMATPSRVTDIIASRGDILDTRLTALPLPGHFIDMLGVSTPDRVVFLADSLFAATILQKYHLIFLYDLQRQFETFAQLRGLQADYYVPSHAALITGSVALGDLIAVNQQTLTENLAFVRSLCQTAVSFEELLSRVCANYQITLNANQAVLIGSTLKSYLAYLSDQHQIAAHFAENRWLWQQLS